MKKTGEPKMRTQHKIFWLIVAMAVLALLFVWSINQRIHSVTQDYIYSATSEVPPADTTLILGALVYTNGEMSPMLSDRVETAVALYKAQKVNHILVSGDHSRVEYDEVNIIKDHLLDLGIPAEDIFLDHAGLDTYDSLYRARDIFQIESLIVVSQNFHLGRAVYIAKELGLEAYGLSSDLQEYRNVEKYEFRELFANLKAFIDLSFGVGPKYLGDPIPISGSSFESWDTEYPER